MINLTEFAKEVHTNAVEHGWWDEERSFGEIIALCHAELSEALEEHRKGKKPNQIYPRCNGNISTITKCEGYCDICIRNKHEGIPVELADCILRILDYCGKENIDIEQVLLQKHKFNKNRPYKHGGKLI